MNRIKWIGKILLWSLFFFTFLVEAYKITLDLAAYTTHSHKFMVDMLFRSIFLLIEIIIVSIAICFMVKKPQRRVRLLSLLSLHVLTILILPLTTRDFGWMGALLPWPLTMMAFDPRISNMVSLCSLIMGFAVVPLLTIKWGVKGFCGYVCPLGGLYSETYGRLFSNPVGRLKAVGRILPPIYFGFMTLSLALIWYQPALIAPLRKIQIMIVFIAAHFFYLVIGIPLVGARSYCNLICPLGYEIRKIVQIKNSLVKKKRQNDKRSSEI